MNSCFVYIIYSHRIDKYYVGYTCDTLPSRLRKHNAKHRGFTAQADDWCIVYSQKFNSKQEAIDREKHIKAWKSRTKIIALIKNT